MIPTDVNVLVFANGVDAHGHLACLLTVLDVAVDFLDGKRTDELVQPGEKKGQIVGILDLSGSVGRLTLQLQTCQR